MMIAARQPSSAQPVQRGGRLAQVHARKCTELMAVTGLSLSKVELALKKSGGDVAAAADEALRAAALNARSTSKTPAPTGERKKRAAPTKTPAAYDVQTASTGSRSTSKKRGAPTKTPAPAPAPAAKPGRTTFAHGDREVCPDCGQWNECHAPDGDAVGMKCTKCHATIWADPYCPEAAAAPAAAPRKKKKKKPTPKHKAAVPADGRPASAAPASAPRRRRGAGAPSRPSRRSVASTPCAGSSGGATPAPAAPLQPLPC
jgi:hypothetical protein